MKKSQFILLIAFFLICSCDTSDYLSYDEYYPDYVEQKIKELNYLSWGDQSASDCFIFITDTHVKSNIMNSPTIIREILKNTSCTKVIWGGDAIWAYTDNSSDTPERAREQILNQWALQVDSFKHAVVPYGTLYNVRGNHDLTMRILKTDTSKKENLGYTFDHNFCREKIIGDMLSNPKVHYNENDNTCYYYFDEDEHKTRYLICDGQSNPIQSGNIAWGNDFGLGVSQEQLTWITQEALLTIPDGYNLIVVIHEGITDITYPSLYGVYKNFANLLNSFVNKEGQFSCINPGYVVVFSGHMHMDLQTYKSNVLHIGTASDYLESEINESMLFEPIPRGAYSTNEQVMDYVILEPEKDMLKCIRIGGGYNRSFHLKKVTLEVDESIILEPDLEAIGYYSYNSEGHTRKNRQWTIVNDVVSVDNGGRVKGLKAGEAVLFAKDQSFNKEFYYIEVKHKQ